MTVEAYTVLREWVHEWVLAVGVVFRHQYIVRVSTLPADVKPEIPYHKFVQARMTKNIVRSNCNSFEEDKRE